MLLSDQVCPWNCGGQTHTGGHQEGQGGKTSPSQTCQTKGWLNDSFYMLDKHNLKKHIISGCVQDMSIPLLVLVWLNSIFICFILSTSSQYSVVKVCLDVTQSYSFLQVGLFHAM